jgi:hypothetical protein
MMMMVVVAIKGGEINFSIARRRNQLLSILGVFLRVVVVRRRWWGCLRTRDDQGCVAICGMTGRAVKEEEERALNARSRHT